MWHTVRYVAESRYLDQEIALKVARERHQEFGILVRGQAVTEPEISTWDVDRFVDAVKAEQGDRTDEIRQRLIRAEQVRWAVRSGRAELSGSMSAEPAPSLDTIKEIAETLGVEVTVQFNPRS